MTCSLQNVVTPTAITTSEIEFYKREGYLSLPNFVTPDALETIRDEISEILEVTLNVTGELLMQASSSADKLRQASSYKTGSKLDAMINSPATLAIASQLIGGPAHRYLPFTAVKAAGGGGQFHFHQDNNYTQHNPAEGSINIWVALVDMTPENGCLQVVPRSHLGGQLTSHNSDDGDVHQQLEINPSTCLPIRMRAGDALAFTRWTVHGSGPNTTDQPRVAYALQYTRHDSKWLDPETGQWKSLVDSPRWNTDPVTSLTPLEN